MLNKLICARYTNVHYKVFRYLLYAQYIKDVWMYQSVRNKCLFNVGKIKNRWSLICKVTM